MATLRREDQSMFIMIAAILIVCTIALIAVLSAAWQLIAAPVNTAISTIGEFLSESNTVVDYNFQVPEGSQATVIPQPTPEPEPIPQPAPVPQPEQQQPEVIAEGDVEIDYNFPIPPRITTGVAQIPGNFEDAILNDAQLLSLANGGAQISTANLQIIIPKINVNSPIMQGFNSEELLKQGFWVSPGSNKLGEGEVVMLCHRRYFGPNDPRTCWYLDKVTRGDEIIVKYNNTDLRYNVVGVNVFEGEDPLIYSTTSKGDYIKIVTCTPLYSNTHRIVVLAKRVS